MTKEAINKAYTFLIGMDVTVPKVKLPELEQTLRLL